MFIMKRITILLLLTIVFQVVTAQNDWENGSVIGINKEAPHASMNGVETITIDGKWKFKYCKDISETPSQFYASDYNDANWDEINVPGTWYANGYVKKLYHTSYPMKLVEKNELIPPKAPKENAVGLYRYEFTIPDAWDGNDNYICFNGVKSAFYLWINGEKVGYSQNSFLPAAFHISKYIHQGKNQLSVQVLRYSDGGYFETQDMWQQEGILRSVKLVSRPQIHIADYFVHTELTDNYKNAVLNLNVSLDEKVESENYTVEATILDGKNVFLSLQGQTNDSIAFTKKVFAPKLWSAEKPNLYKLEIALKDSHGKTVDKVFSQMGFRQTEIIDGIFFLNGKMVKLKGVNRHDFDLNGGTAVPYSSYKKDLMLMKQMNINCIRTSHYPSDEAFYTICDSLGLWVVDEAFEAVNPKKLKGAFAVNSEDWYYVAAKRVEGMIKRDRNHPSVAIWSLANESGQNRENMNWVKLRDLAHKIDPTRPVEYDNAYNSDDYAADLDTRMYPSIEWIKDWFKEKHPKKPLFMFEYGHARGNSLGSMKEYWEYIESEPRCMGGCIWEWKNHAFSTTDENGKLRYLDRKEMDADFENVPDPLQEHCLNGMIQPDWKVKPGLLDLKYAHQWIKILPLDFTQNLFLLRNTYKFTSTKDMAIEWELRKNGVVVESGVLTNLSCDAESQLEFKVPLKTPIFLEEGKNPDDEYFISFKTVLVKAQNYADPGHCIAFTQLAYPFTNYKAKFGITSTRKYNNSEPLKVRTEKETITISNKNVSLVFDRNTASIIQWKYGSTEILNGKNAGPKLNLFRAPVDNDKPKRYGAYADWKAKGLDSLNLVSAICKMVSKSKTEVTIQSNLVYAGNDSVKIKHQLVYSISANGAVVLNNKVETYGLDELFSLARVGLQIKINKNLGDYTWYGAGPENNWDDRRLAAPVALYTRPLNDLWFEYIRPQEASNRSNVRYLKVGNAIRFSSDSIFSFTAHPYEDQDILHANRQGWLKERSYAVLSLDYKMMGTGCGSMGVKRMNIPLAQYRILPGNYSFSFEFNPIHK